MWGWLLSRPPGALEDQADMIITFVVLPLTLALWVVGGPVTLALAKQVRERNRPGKDRDHRLAVAGIVLSRLMLWGAAGLLLWRIYW
jgi:sorbitol-specific phosphotransferase system component IIC